MTTVTLKYDGRVKIIAKLLEAISMAGGIIEPAPETKHGSIDDAIKEYRTGKTYKAKNGKDLIEKCLK